MRSAGWRNYVPLLFGLLLPLMLLLAHGVAPVSLKVFNHELIKWDLPEAFKVSMQQDDPNKRANDSFLKVLRNKPVPPIADSADTLKHRVLLIGDSQCDGLLYPLNNYCLANGHKLVGSVIWYSSTVYNFSKADTIRKVLKQMKPTYIVLVLGLNEIYARDLKNRQLEAVKLIRSFGTTPYTWIGPAFWENDKGIDTAYRNVIEAGAYFSSKHLVLSRGDDKRHPDRSGYRIWFDQIKAWLSEEARYKLILAKKPEKEGNSPFKGRLVLLHAAKYKGY